MKEKIKKRIIESGGEIVHNEFYYIQAIYPESNKEKAALLFLDITERLDVNASLSGGNKLTVYFY